MKKVLSLLVVCFSVLFVHAQTPQKYWVQFTNKGNTPYSISSPAQYLSQRAIQRRTIQNIPIDSLDLPVTPMYVNAVAATGVTVHAKSKWLNGVVIITADANALNQIAAMPFVSLVTGAGLRVSGTGENKFDKETYTAVGESQRIGAISSSTMNYGQSFNQIDMIGGVCLHNAGFKGQGMVIAVIDAGFYSVDTLPAFDSLWANNRILGTRDFVAGDTMVFEDNTHGMMVLSCMGGYIDGQIIGTAPEAAYWLLRSEEAATEYIVEEYYWAIAAEFADSVGADVINSSLGYTVFDDSSQNHTYADMNGNTAPCTIAADVAASRGMIVVNSAGNSGASSWFYIGAPADADSILAVGAVDASGQYASFSSRGPSYDGDIKPDVAAQGAGTTIASPGGGIQSGNGTSFASPVLCGAVTCLWQAHPGMTNMQVMNVIRQSASQFTNPDTYLGYGIPDFCAANLTLSGNAGQQPNEDAILNTSPNPFSDFIQFGFYSLNNQNITVRLTDVTGRLILEKQVFAVRNAVNNYTLSDLGLLNSGMFFLTVITADKSVSVKLLRE